MIINKGKISNKTKQDTEGLDFERFPSKVTFVIFGFSEFEKSMKQFQEERLWLPLTSVWTPPAPLCSLGVAIADEKDDLSARLAALS